MRKSQLLGIEACGSQRTKLWAWTDWGPRGGCQSSLHIEEILMKDACKGSTITREKQDLVWSSRNWDVVREKMKTKTLQMHQQKIFLGKNLRIASKPLKISVSVGHTICRRLSLLHHDSLHFHVSFRCSLRNSDFHESVVLMTWRAQLIFKSSLLSHCSSQESRWQEVYRFDPLNEIQNFPLYDVTGLRWDV